MFAWRPWGSGRRALPCARCGALAPVWVLENLLEVLCPACGRNVAVERLRALAADGGEEAVRGALEALGVDSAPGELPPAGGDLVERLLDAGLLRRDLRLVLELCPSEGWHAYGAAPLRDVILPAELRAALASRRRQGGVLSELLREQALARFAASVRSVGRESGLPALSGPTEVEAEAVAALPRRALEEFRAVPVRREGDALVVAVWDPLDPRVVADLESLAGRPVQAVLGEPALLEECLVRLGVGPRPRAPEVETGPPLPEAAVEDELTPSLSELLLEALEEGATEVLVEPRPEGASLRLRVGGELRKERCLPRSAPTALAEELGLRGGPRAAVGVLRCEVSGLPLRLRHRVLPTPLGPAVALVLDADDLAAEPGLGGLGLDLEELAAFEQALAGGRGVFVLAAPTRGERVGAYRAVLARAVRLGGSVLSLEAPLLRPLDGAVQVEGPTSSAEAVALAQPRPDWLGLCGPLERIALRLAVDTALEGGAVVLAVPAPSAATALGRLEFAGLPRTLLDALVRAVVVRREVPRLCPHCRVAHEGGWLGIGCAACGEQGTRGCLPLASLTGPALAEVSPPRPALTARVRSLAQRGEVSWDSVADFC